MPPGPDDGADDDADVVGRIADELYGLAPKEFVAARDARARALRAAGSAAAAREVAALRRPTVAAWLANQLVREHGAEIDPLLELGAGLREAAEALSGPQLRELSKQRAQLVAALVRQARKLAAADGQPVTEDAARALEQTLLAALADEELGEQLRAGRLTGTLTHSVFGSPADRPVAPRRTPAPRRPSRTAPTAEEQERAERRTALEAELAAAWKAARAAADTRADAEDAAIVADRVASESRRTLERLRAELARAESDHDAAVAARDAAAESRAAARADAERATKRVSELQRALDDT